MCALALVGSLIGHHPGRVFFFALDRFRSSASSELHTLLDVAFFAEIGFGVDGQPDRQGPRPRADRARGAPGGARYCTSSSVIRKLRSSAPSSTVLPSGAEFHFQVLGGAAQNFAGEFFVVLDVLLALALLDAVERRLRDEHLPRLISSCMWRKKNVSSSVRMWEPSTSASVMMMILP